LAKAEGKPVETTLYDNQEDPYQMKNIANAAPEIVRRLTNEELVPWLKKTHDTWLVPGLQNSIYI
jgi:hypothetical protein